MGEWDGSIGCFTYITKKGLQTIGGFRTEYIGYGFEDAEYKFRAIKAGLTKGQIKAPIRSYAYIHSEDVFGENPNPNLSFEEKNKFIDLNSSIYLNDLNSDLIYYEYRT
jgi:GT2 family glycosyltransferase